MDAKSERFSRIFTLFPHNTSIAMISNVYYTVVECDSGNGIVLSISSLPTNTMKFYTL